MKVALFLSSLLGLVYVSDKLSRQFQSPKWVIRQTVQTGSDAVKGHAVPNVSEVSEYLGIPFTMPPIGIFEIRTSSEIQQYICCEGR
jgi:hypothetical protein